MEENKITEITESKLTAEIVVKNIHYEWDNLNDDDVSLETVIGQEDAKKAFNEIIKCLKIKEAGMTCETPESIMLYGYPGTGKSMLMKALKHEILKYPDLAIFKELKNNEITAYVGSTEKKVAEYFEKLRTEACDRLMVLAMDEGDDIVPKKEGLGAIEGERVSGILTEFDGLNKNLNKNLVVVITTNHPNKIEPAMLRSNRIGFHVLAEMPSESERIEGIKKYIGGLPGITELIISSIHTWTPKWTHSDYRSLRKQLVNEIKFNYITNPDYILTLKGITEQVSWVTKHRKTNFATFEQEYKEYSKDHDNIFEQIKNGVPTDGVVSSTNTKTEIIETPKKKRVIKRKIIRNKQEINSQ